MYVTWKLTKSSLFCFLWEFNIVLFSCLGNSVYLCSRQKIYVDGRFNYCPKCFCKMFTVHTVEKGNYIPLDFFLLKNKWSHYGFTPFDILKMYCQSLTLHLESKEIICDFEKAIQVGLRKFWRAIKIVGCRFHLTQSWYRKIGDLWV